MKFKCAVIEDEPEARKLLIEKLQEYPDEIEVVGSAEGIKTGIQLLENTPTDIVFLDIKIIGGNSFQIIKTLKERKLPIPLIVVVSANDKESIEANNDYKEHILHSIVKPFEADYQSKIAAILSKAQQEFQVRTRQQRTHIRVDTILGEIYNIALDDILFIAVEKNDRQGSTGRICIYTNQLSNPINKTLAAFLEELPSDKFVQIFRNHAINIKHIHKVSKPDRKVMLKGYDTQLDIGNSYYDAFMKAWDRG
jgi:two-component system, LytTR family, response regulator